MRPSRTFQTLKRRGLSVRGDIRIALSDLPSGAQSIDEMLQRPGTQLIETHNLENDFVLQAIAKAFTGESGKVGDVSIVPQSMAFGTGTVTVKSSDSVLDSEMLRHYFSSSGSVTRNGSTAIFRITLHPGEVLPNVSGLALFGPDAGGASAASGSITISGTPFAGDSIVVRLGARSIPPLWVGSGQSTTAVAAALASWLNQDGTFGSLYTCTSSSSTVNITSIGKGTVYNQTIGVTATGTTGASASGMTGGASPGGQLLASANTSFSKGTGQQLIVEWSIVLANA